MNWQTATEEDREKVKNWMEQNAPDDWANMKSFKVMGATLQEIERCKTYLGKDLGEKPGK